MLNYFHSLTMKGMTLIPKSPGSLIGKGAAVLLLVGLPISSALAEGENGGRPSESQKTEKRIDRGEGDSAAFGAPQDAGLEGGISTTTLSTTIPSLGNFTVTYWARSDVGKDSVHDQNPQATTINRFTLGYRLNDHQEVLGGQEIDIAYAHISANSSANMNDAWVGYMDTKLATLGEWNITGSARLYVPNGEQSHFVTMRQGALAGILLAERTIGNFDFANFFFAIKHNQTQNSFNIIAGQTTIPTYNDNGEVDNYFEGDYHLNDTFAVYHAIGIEQIWECPMPVIGIQQNRHLYNETGIRAKIAKGVAVAASFWNDASILNSKVGYSSLYRDDESGFRMYFSASL